MIISDNKIINKVFEQGGRTFPNVNCWVKQEENFNIYIFTATCSSEKELLETYDGLNNDIALYFQTMLQKYPEIWNIYIFFFVEESVSINTKYIVEQDKYCSRKLVFDNKFNFSDKNSIIKLITNKLFALDIKRVTESSDLSLNFQDKIKKQNPEIYELLDILKGKDNRREMTSLINHFLKEHNYEL